MEYLNQLGAFGADLQYANLPQNVRQQLGWVLVDTLGAIVGGSAEPELRAMAQSVSHGNGATLVGLGVKASPMEAALINGTAGTFLEMDEGNRFSRGHPAIHVLPAVLALSETQGADAHRFLAALAVGYETGSRFGASAQLRDAIHVHGTWGTLGAAAGSARVFGADPSSMRESFNVASSMTIATSKKTMLQGGLVRNVYAGLSNSNGLLAAQLVRCGFQGEADGPASLFGEIVSERYDQVTLLRGLGEEWHLTQNYFKLHSCCRYNHGTLDALDILAERGTLPAAVDISSIEVTTYKYAAELTDPAPRNTLGAKFSVPFAVATRIVNGSSGLSSFTRDAIRNPDVLALASRVSIVEDPAMTARLPQERPARVRVFHKNGQVHEVEVGVNRGDDTSPYTTQELSSKFLDLCERVWSRSHADALLNSTLALGEAKSGDTAHFLTWLQMLSRTADH